MYQYLETPYSFDFKASMFNFKNVAPPKRGGNFLTSPMAGSTEESNIASPVTNQQKSNAVSPLTMTLLQQAGFTDFSLKTVGFDGLLFDQIDVKDAIALPVIHQNIVDAKGKNMASVYSFLAKSKELAKEVYEVLKKKFADQNIGIFNETHDFGEASFYLNAFRFPEIVFLVVKKNENVYALTYGKSQHGFIKKLLLLLP